MDSNCILLVSDQEYLKYFYPLIASIRKHVDMDKVAVRAHFINLEKRDENYIIDTFPNASFTFEQKALSDLPIRMTRYPELPFLNGKPVTDKHAYCNNKRYEILEVLLGTNYKNILYMDVDNLIRGDLTGLFDIISDHDITVHKYPLDRHPIAWRRFMTYCCGIIGVHNNDTTKKFFKRMNEETTKHGIYEIGDQLDFRNVLSEFKRDISVGQIPQHYKDDTFAENSLIWTGDGNKKSEPTFQNAIQNSQL
jgi:hypothetical protein